MKFEINGSLPLMLWLSTSLIVVADGRESGSPLATALGSDFVYASHGEKYYVSKY